MKKLILIALGLIGSFGTTQAQQIYKGGGTSNSTFLFGYVSYARKSQCIFWPSDLTNVQSGTINRLYYKYGSTGTTNNQVLTNFNIQIGQTTATAFSGSYDFFTGLTPVMSAATYTIPAGTAGNWFPIDLDVAFNYDATQTLIIQLSFDTSAVQAWGTYGTSNNPVKKIITPDLNATVGDGSSGTWQDMGFDLGAVGIQQATSPVFALNVSPNPANEQFELRFKSTNNSFAEMQLSDVAGRLLKQQMVSPGINNLVDVRTYDPGIYFVTLKSESDSEVRKIIIE